MKFSKVAQAFYAVLFILMMSVAITMTTGVSPLIPFTILLAVGFLAGGGLKKAGFALMAVTVEVWENDILENLFKNNAFAKRAYSADQYVLSGKVVHIPRAGTPSSVTKNLDTFPATAVKRTDDDITYAIDTFYSTPRHIENIEKYELSYDKRQSALGEDQSALIETAMDGLLFNWAPLVANTVLTEGANRAATVSGATTDVLKFTKSSLEKIKLQMDKAKISAQGRVALLTPEHYNDFFNSLSDGEKTNFNRVADLPEGVVGRYLGFDISMRATVLRYRGADAAIAKVDEYATGFAASDKTEDRGGSLVYQEKCVERAFGSVEMFDRTKDPLYYGDVFSFQLRMGGRIRRTAGVWAVVDALAA